MRAASSDERLSVSDLSYLLKEQLEMVEELHGKVGGLVPLGPPKRVEDDPTKALIQDVRGKPIAVVLCSNRISPNLVGRGVAAAAEARRRLGSALGSVILTRLAAGEIEGLSFVILPWRQPLSSSPWKWRMQRAMLRSHVLRWLRGAVKVTAHGRGRRAAQDAFMMALRSLHDERLLPLEIRKRAAVALERLESGAWQPVHSLDHNDFWTGNILLNRSADGTLPGEYPFLLIDWPGANAEGYGLYDLVRAARSFRVRSSQLTKEIRFHSAALHCEPTDAPGHLLASLGDLRKKLEYFPLDKYVGVVELCWAKILSAT